MRPATPLSLRTADEESVRRLLLAAERFLARWRGLRDLSANEQLVVAHTALAGPLTAGRLATAVSLSTGGLSAVLHRLERDGYVQRVRNPEDARSIIVAPAERALPLRDAITRLARAMDHHGLPEQKTGGDTAGWRGVVDAVASELERQTASLRATAPR